MYKSDEDKMMSDPNIKWSKSSVIKKDQFKKDLIDLFEDIIYQTGYMTNSWGDTSMLSQMAIEDQISPWSIESEVNKFKRKYNIIKKPIQMEFNFND